MNDETTEGAESASSPQQFKYSETTPARGSGISTGFGDYFLAFGALIGGAIIGGLTGVNLATYVGIGGFILLMGRAIVSTLFGVPDFVRQGPCPHCATLVTLRNIPEASTKCSGCRRPLLLRDDKIYDVS